jgi:hypothetical protein
MIGDKEKALAELTHLFHIPSQFTTANTRVDPVFKSLRSDPRFEALLNDPKNNAPLF